MSKLAWPDYIQNIAAMSGDTKHTDQTKAFHAAVSRGENIFLAGNAGTGKSHQLRLMMMALAQAGAVVVALAPTGVAANNIGGQTIHSFFRFPLSALEESDAYASANNPRNSNMQAATSIDVIVIDEVSMVRADVMDCIDRTLRIARRSRKPFGGVQMIIMGDVYQLPPVTRESDVTTYLKDTFGSATFFCAPAFNGPWTLCELTHVFRQADREFSGIMDRFREGEPTDADLARLSRLVALRDREAVCLTTTRKLSNVVNEKELLDLQMPVSSYEAEIKGAIQASDTPAERLLRLAVGARVMMLVNDRKQGFVNGSLGRISRLDITTTIIVGSDEYGEPIEKEVPAIAIKLDHPTAPYEVVVSQFAWERMEYQWDAATKSLDRKVTGELKQFPVRLAWAMTIHKAQGLTLPRVHVDLGTGAFESGQAYVALSRATGFEGLTLQRQLDRWDVKVSPDAKWYRERFKAVAPAADICLEAPIVSAERVSEEVLRRIKLSVWAYAYEFLNESIVSDETFDKEALNVDLSIDTGRPDLDEWFRKNFDPSTGLWIRQHPEIEHVKALTEMKLGMRPRHRLPLTEGRIKQLEKM